MEDNVRMRWLDLCATAAICEDPKRLEELTTEICDILRSEKERLEERLRPIRLPS